MSDDVPDVRDVYNPFISLCGRVYYCRVVIGAYSTAKLSPPSTRVRGNGEVMKFFHFIVCVCVCMCMYVCVCVCMCVYVCATPSV